MLEYFYALLDIVDDVQGINQIQLLSFFFNYIFGHVLDFFLRSYLNIHVQFEDGFPHHLGRGLL